MNKVEVKSLTQEDVSQLIDMLTYARLHLVHPDELLRVEPITRYSKSSPESIRAQAEYRIKRLQEYEKYIDDINNMLTYLKSYDLAKEVKVSVSKASKRKMAKLGELLESPNKYDDLGKRGPVVVDCSRFTEAES